MFFFSNILGAVAEILDMLLHLYMWAIIINALISWVNPDPYNPIVRFLYKITEPVLAPLRRIIPIRSMGIGIDPSPILAIFIIVFLRRAIVKTLLELSFRLGGH